MWERGGYWALKAFGVLLSACGPSCLLGWVTGDYRACSANALDEPSRVFYICMVHAHVTSRSLEQQWHAHAPADVASEMLSNNVAGADTMSTIQWYSSRFLVILPGDGHSNRIFAFANCCQPAATPRRAAADCSSPVV